MEKEKLIEEMARVIDIDCGECYTCQYYESKGINCTCLLQAEELYNAGYRRQEDILHEWVERETAYLNEIAELKKELKKELAEHEEFTKKAKAEIERLTEREKFLENAWKTSLEHTETVERGLKASKARTAEFQKQVDELKAKQVIECHGMLKGCDIVKQAVKDTAKEILQGFNKWLKQAISDAYDKSVKGSFAYRGGRNNAFHEVKELVKKVAESKGVEVE